ncbi:IS1/IS1595 family N-terminal zinc-binding domain-containing protein [Legionella cincinnatiensis]|uniref:IS1/IS1595 family N-terminal zinc-binding domain-containing protein n=1 Tax=Legionella cincinnatiensis TaxID=28085 RepID=UPI001041B73E|nr:IS1 family transposase [Legionella cincinnatiensis]
MIPLLKAVRDLRWPEKTQCPYCNSDNVIRHGKEDTEQYQQRYECKDCFKRFDDLTNTVFSGHQTWVLFLYFLGLNLQRNRLQKS